MQRTIIIGTRGSDLALWQARFLQEELKRAGYSSELKIIKTQGDQVQHLSLEKLEGKGFFTKEIEDALLEKSTDIAVHSHKDLPTEMTPGLTIAGVSYREDPSELLLIRKTSVDQRKTFSLQQHAVVGTSSSRRTLQLLFYRPDLEIKDIRGNVPTRIEKLRRGDFDAILLASAGVARLGLDISDLHTIHIKPHQFIPAPAQGVLAYQCRKDDIEMIDILRSISHADVAETIAIEREVMRLFQGGCHMPLGVYCEKNNAEFHIWAMQSAGRGEPVKRLFMRAKENNAAADIFQKLRSSTNKKVFVTTDADDATPFLQLLRAKGFMVNCCSLLQFNPIPFSELPACDWIFFTSKNGVRYFFEQADLQNKHYRFAAIGEETAAEIGKYGFGVGFTGEGEADEIAGSFLQQVDPKSVLFPQALHANHTISDLVATSATVHRLPVYENHPAKNTVMDDADILVFTSAMNAEAYISSNKIHEGQTVIAIGNTTKAYLTERGIENVLTPPHKNMISVADLICGLDLADH